MSIIQEEWYLHNANFKSYMSSGKAIGLIKPFDNKEIFKNIRNVFCNNIPASALILVKDFAQEYRFSSAKLLAYAFQDKNSEVVTATIDAYRLNPKCRLKYLNGELDENYANHYYVRRLEKDGKYWIYDPTLGVKIEENLYNSMQNPIVIKTSQKTSLDGLCFSQISGEALVEKEDDIKDAIYSIREACPPVGEEYKAESYKADESSIHIREEYVQILLDELDAIEKEIDACKETITVSTGAKK